MEISSERTKDGWIYSSGSRVTKRGDTRKPCEVVTVTKIGRSRDSVSQRLGDGRNITLDAGIEHGGRAASVRICQHRSKSSDTFVSFPRKMARGRG